MNDPKKIQEMLWAEKLQLLEETWDQEEADRTVAVWIERRKLIEGG